MVKLINTTFGNVMYVSEDRLEEYLAAGHKLADAAEDPAPKQEDPKPKRAAKKK